MVRIVWTEKAECELREIANYIAFDSPHYAELTIKKIINRTKVLYNHPEIGRVFSLTDQENVRYISEGQYVIFYRLNLDNLVEVLTIRHSSRDTKDLVLR
jgi:toxin ParE1/3/4